jgi:hypothetical protein
VIAWRGRSGIARLALPTLLVLLAGGAAAEVLILRSAGPSARQFRPGARLPDDARLRLRPGDSVVVLTRGRTRLYRGPGMFQAGGPLRNVSYNDRDPDGRSAVGGLRGGDTVRPGIAPGRGRRTQTGAVRDGLVQPRPSDIWQLDITRSGHFCLLPGAMPTLWRPNAISAVELTITAESGESSTIGWPTNQALLGWPADLPLSDQTSYRLSWTGGAVPTRHTIRLLPAEAESDPERLASALLDNECRSQLDVFITLWEETEEASEGADESESNTAPSPGPDPAPPPAPPPPSAGRD